MMLKPREAEGNYGNVSKACLSEGFSDKKYVIRGAATATRLEHNQSDLVYVVFTALERIDKLTYDKYGGIAGVVMAVFEPRVLYVLTLSGKKLGFNSVAVEYFAYHTEVHRQHIGHKDGIVLSHFLCELNVR